MKPEPDRKTPRRRSNRPGSIRQVRARLWAAIEVAADLLEHEDTDTRLRAISAMATAAGVFNRLHETDEIEKRLVQLEATVDQAESRMRA